MRAEVIAALQSSGFLTVTGTMRCVKLTAKAISGGFALRSRLENGLDAEHSTRVDKKRRLCLSVSDGIAKKTDEYPATRRFF